MIWIIFIAGLVMIIFGYFEHFKNCEQTVIEYRYIPRIEYDQQYEPNQNLKKSFGSMFSEPSAWIQYPFDESGLQNKYNTDNYNNFFKLTK